MKRKHKIKPAPPKTTKGMSETLLDFAWAYAIQDQSDPMQRQHFMNVACSAWNFSLLSDDDCQHAIVSFIDNMRAASDPNDGANMKALENDLHALIAWEKDHYPAVRKMVVSAELYDDGNKVGCRTTSADYDMLV